jgi:hypothetical protein
MRMVIDVDVRKVRMYIKHGTGGESWSHGVFTEIYDALRQLSQTVTFKAFEFEDAADER